MIRRILPVVALLCSATSSLAADEWEPAKTHAVIVGVLEWQNGLSSFPKGSRKDQELRDVLVKRGVLEENIDLILDDEATLPRIREAVAHAAMEAEPGSTLIVYYAGHGWSAGDDFCFANYEVDSSKQDTAWSLRELGATLAKDFKGQRAFLWADCCYSGGLEVVVDALAKENVNAFCLTSASTADTSTSNWTFTQSIIDGLNGEPIVDANSDGDITLGELNAEVRDAMQHLEGQPHGFKASGVNDDLVLAAASGSRPKASSDIFAIGSYVEAGNRYGRIVGADGDHYTVQFYNYSDKVTEQFAAQDLVASTRQPRKTIAPIDAGVVADSEVEWRGEWFPAKVIKAESDRWRIHYIGYEESWDEWVDAKRIRLNK